MHFHHKIQSVLTPAYTIIKKITSSYIEDNFNSLRVLAYHDIPINQIDKLKNQLNWIKSKRNIVTPKKFELMITGKEPIIGHNVLITFDDGFYSNRIVAEKVLEPLNINAIFFIIPEFASIKDQEESRYFVANNIIPNSKITDIPTNLINMQWDDLKILLDCGHTIGSHTKTHFRLSSLTRESDLRDQIIDSGDILSEHLGVDIDHFAYSFGDIGSFSEAAFKVARRRYKFIYSGIRGNNLKNFPSNLIKRDAAAFQLKNNQYEVFSNKLLDSFLEGFADIRYKKHRAKMDSWV